MKQLYVADNTFSAQMMKDYLSEFRIETFIQGEMLQGAVGELPANNFPTLWIVDDDDYDRAISLIERREADASFDQMYDSVWKCEYCDELIEAQFTQCWHCGKERSKE